MKKVRDVAGMRIEPSIIPDCAKKEPLPFCHRGAFGAAQTGDVGQDFNCSRASMTGDGGRRSRCHCNG